jgi:hypothetical protein
LRDSPLWLPSAATHKTHGSWARLLEKKRSERGSVRVRATRAPLGSRRGLAVLAVSFLCLIHRMCYKRPSEAQHVHAGANGFSGERISTREGHRFAATQTERRARRYLRVLPQLFGAFGTAQLQNEVSDVRLLHVVLGFLLRPPPRGDGPFLRTHNFKGSPMKFQEARTWH